MVMYATWTKYRTTCTTHLQELLRNHCHDAPAYVKARGGLQMLGLGDFYTPSPHLGNTALYTSFLNRYRGTLELSEIFRTTLSVANVCGLTLYAGTNETNQC